MLNKPRIFETPDSASSFTNGQNSDSTDFAYGSGVDLQSGSDSSIMTGVGIGVGLGVGIGVLLT